MASARVQTRAALPARLQEIAAGKVVHRVEYEEGDVLLRSVTVHFTNGSWLRVDAANGDEVAITAGKVVEEDLTP